MPERIPQSVAKLVVFRAYLASDGKTLATGKTIAVTISKNGGAFGNPNAGATNATEISSGFYKFTLDTTDTGTKGPVAWRGAQADINDAGDVYEVVNATNAGFTALPDAAAEAAGGLYTRGTGAGQIAQDANGNVRVNLDTIKTQTVTCAAGVTVLASVGTAATSTAQTGDGYAIVNSGTHGNAALKTLIDAAKSDTAAILIDTSELQTDWADGGRLDLLLDATLADTNELQADWADGGRLDLILDARASQTSVNTIDGIVDDILLDTAEIGAAGAGLTNINLPNQTMDIVGNITGNLSGSVGSVSGAVGSVTGNVGGNVAGSVASVTAGVTLAANSVTASALAADAVTEIVNGILAGEITELAGVPVASPTLEAALALLYMSVRNKRTTSETEDKIHNSAGSVIATATVADDGSEFEKAKYA